MLNINKKDVEGVYLLSVEESETIPKWILSNGHWWWLRSSGYRSDRALFVETDGIVYTVIGSSVDDDDGGVRPALRIQNLDSMNLKIGETVMVLDRLAQYIGDNSVLLCEFIGKHRFDKRLNDYKTSEIRQFLKDWAAEMWSENDD